MSNLLEGPWSQACPLPVVECQLREGADRRLQKVTERAVHCLLWNRPRTCVASAMPVVEML